MIVGILETMCSIISLMHLIPVNSNSLITIGVAAVASRFSQNGVACQFLI